MIFVKKLMGALLSLFQALRSLFQEQNPEMVVLDTYEEFIAKLEGLAEGQPACAKPIRVELRPGIAKNEMSVYGRHGVMGGYTYTIDFSTIVSDTEKAFSFTKDISTRPVQSIGEHAQKEAKRAYICLLGKVNGYLRELRNQFPAIEFLIVGEKEMALYLANQSSFRLAT